MRTSAAGQPRMTSRICHSQRSGGAAPIRWPSSRRAQLLSRLMPATSFDGPHPRSGLTIRTARCAITPPPMRPVGSCFSTDACCGCRASGGAPRRDSNTGPIAGLRRRDCLRCTPHGARRHRAYTGRQVSFAANPYLGSGGPWFAQNALSPRPVTDSSAGRCNGFRASISGDSQR